MPTVHHANRTPHTALKNLRKICGLTQTQLAQKIGVSAASIIAVEVGNLPLSKKMAGRISAVLGVHPDSLLAGGDLLAWDGAPFTKNTVQGRHTAPTYSQGEVVHDSPLFAKSIGAVADVYGLLEAATLANKLPLVSFLIREKVYEIVRELSLESAFLKAYKMDDFLLSEMPKAVMLKMRIEKALLNPEQPTPPSGQPSPTPPPVESPKRPKRRRA